MTQIGVCCLFGQTINTAYDSLSMKLYESDWINVINDREYSQIMIFMIEYLNGETVVFVGKIVPLLSSTFTSVCHIL